MKVGVSTEPDPCIRKIRKLFKRTGWTLQEFGLRLGYPESCAKQAVFQLFGGVNPTIKMIRKVAEVLDVTVEDLL